MEILIVNLLILGMPKIKRDKNILPIFVPRRNGSSENDITRNNPNISAILGRTSIANRVSTGILRC
jgi:hypothetical protein